LDGINAIYRIGEDAERFTRRLSFCVLTHPRQGIGGLASCRGADRQEEGESYQAIRRGWSFGGETFRQVLLGRAQGLAGESHHAGLRSESDE